MSIYLSLYIYICLCICLHDQIRREIRVPGKAAHQPG